MPGDVPLNRLSTRRDEPHGTLEHSVERVAMGKKEKKAAAEAAAAEADAAVTVSAKKSKKEKKAKQARKALV